MAEPLLHVESDGPSILRTNFWATEMARAGKFFLSTNAGAFRLLVPRQHVHALRDMRTAHTVVVSRGPMTLEGQQLLDAMEVLFDDASDTPFSLHLTPQACDRLPLDADTAQEWVCTVWTHVVGERCQLALELPCYYRRVWQLPDLRPWQGHTQ